MKNSASAEYKPSATKSKERWYESKHFCKDTFVVEF